MSMDRVRKRVCEFKKIKVDIYNNDDVDALHFDRRKTCKNRNYCTRRSTVTLDEHNLLVAELSRSSWSKRLPSILMNINFNNSCFR